MCIRDSLWVGARTTANPFAVQEIADALKGVDIPVDVYKRQSLVNSSIRTLIITYPIVTTKGMVFLKKEWTTPLKPVWD